MAALTGTVISINSERGFAFIRQDGVGQPDVFFHIRDVLDPITTLDDMRYAKVSCNVVSDPTTGKLKATEVWLVN